RRHKFRRNPTNREFYRRYEDYPAVKTFDAGLEFLEINRTAKNWFLQIETFDPHEPFDVPAEFREDYKTNYRGPLFDFPPYARVTEMPDAVAEVRANYAATLAHCDRQFGRVLEFFDRHDLWSDTALIVSTDHGFLLGEQDLWAKLVVPVFNEVAHIPLMIHHPQFRDRAGTRCTALTQTIDLMPTILDMYGVKPPAEVQGSSLLPLLAGTASSIRDAALYGSHGAALNITDGRYTYFRYPENMQDGNLNQYTLMPTHILSRFSVAELRDATLADGFDFTQGLKVLKVPATEKSPYYNRHGPGAQIDCETRLFDLANDPAQRSPIAAPAVEAALCEKMVRLMRDTDAPAEAYARFGLLDIHERASHERASGVADRQ
ncbi:MAG: sulfatase, partial [Alphaproteobacteria bacterium]|nr:sulfatase [Alphaproteobacteria bacterium]